MVTILVFEGPDKVGKSSLIREINQRTDFQYLCIDRFIGSAWVYDNLSGRRTRTEELMTTERELAQLQETKVINVILTCDEGILQNRVIAKDEAAVDRIKFLERAIQLYQEYARHMSTLPTIEVDTTDKSIDDTVEEILRKVNEI